MTLRAMPKLGDIRRASEVGYTGRALLVWDACPGCGRTKWQYQYNKGRRCWSCAAQERAREQYPITYFGEGTPQIGDTAQAKVLGYSMRGVMVFAACPVCQQGHWVRSKDIHNTCIHCIPKASGHRHSRWSGGRRTKRGYILVRIGKDDPLFATADHNGWVLEHRLVVARRIGRPLMKGEVVHHINGIKSDNRDSNLQLLMEKRHNSHLVVKELQARLHGLESRVTTLEAENVLLRSLLGKPIPNQAESDFGRRRDLTGDTLQCEGEGKVHPSGKLEDNDA